MCHLLCDIFEGEVVTFDLQLNVCLGATMVLEQKPDNQSWQTLTNQVFCHQIICLWLPTSGTSCIFLAWFDEVECLSIVGLHLLQVL